ncbi:hypothetical protein FRC12_005828 [Ceratobasidium sp. 428]|nr:hypothetical protein FRC12_005828 [Ceratobasidium sp. 428]
MPVASLGTLPADVLLNIFSVSTPASIRVCRHVCRTFKQLISTTDHLQYLLALDTCGYVEPLCPRTDLSYAQKKQILFDHWNRWYNPSSDELVTSHELPTGKGRVEASAKGTTIWSPEGTMGYMFFQNPSNNRGVGLKKWNFRPDSYGYSIAINPELNLLAVLDEQYTIRLLTATTLERHPKSPMLPIVFNHDGANTFGTTWGDGIELFGSLIVGVFAMDQRVMISTLVIWNWATGQEVMRLLVKTSRHNQRRLNRIFDFVSEDTLVVCRRFDPTEALAQSLPGNTFGLLDIYKFDPLAVLPATLVASLALPANIIKGETETPAVYFSSSPYIPPSLQPQVWETSPGTRTLCVSIDGMHRWENVCVQAKTLLGYGGGTTSNSIIRWDEWGPQAAWDKWDGPISKGSNRIKTQGHRIISMKCLWIAKEIEVNFFELERTQDGQIAPALKAKFVVGPDMSQPNGGEALNTGPRTEIDMNDECIMMFRETLSSD